MFNPQDTSRRRERQSSELEGSGPPAGAIIRQAGPATPLPFMRIDSLLSCVALVAVGASPALAQDYDILIADGFVVDGTGNPWYRADVAVSGDRPRADRVIDAGGLWVTPGFIDPHSHAAGGLSSAELSHARPLLA